MAEFLLALPTLIKLFNEVWIFFKQLSGGDTRGFILELGQAFEQLNKAENSDEKRAAAQSIAKLIRKL